MCTHQTIERKIIEANIAKAEMINKQTSSCNWGC